MKTRLILLGDFEIFSTLNNDQVNLAKFNKLLYKPDPILAIES
jgi:hypothetical protein